MNRDKPANIATLVPLVRTDLLYTNPPTYGISPSHFCLTQAQRERCGPLP